MRACMAYIEGAHDAGPLHLHFLISLERNDETGAEGTLPIQRGKGRSEMHVMQTNGYSKRPGGYENTATA